MPQNIILLIEPYEEKGNCSFKIGKLYMNKLTIDEDESNEILFIGLLKKASAKMNENLYPYHREFIPLELEAKHKSDRQIIDTALRNELTYHENHAKTHLILSMFTYDKSSVNARIQLHKIITNVLKDLQIESIILTVLHMTRSSLYTKEMVDGCFNNSIIFEGVSVRRGVFSKGLLYKSPDTMIRLTLSDDLDNCLYSISKLNFMNGNDEWQRSMMFYKLTEEEKKSLVEWNNNCSHDFFTFSTEFNPEAKQLFDESKKSHLKSEFGSRYGVMICCRRTILIKNLQISWTEDHSKMLNKTMKVSVTRSKKCKKSKKKK